MRITNISTNNYNRSTHKNSIRKAPSFAAKFIYNKENGYARSEFHIKGIPEIEEKLANELPNIKVVVNSFLDGRLTNNAKIDKHGGFPGQRFEIGFVDGLKARDDILEQQEKYQTLPKQLIEEYKNYNPELVDRIGGGYVAVEMGHYPDRETLNDFADRCAAKIREVAKNLPELLLTKKMELNADGGVIRKDSKHNYTFRPDWKSIDIEKDRWFCVKYQPYYSVRVGTKNIPLG